MAGDFDSVGSFNLPNNLGDLAFDSGKSQVSIIAAYSSYQPFAGGPNILIQLNVPCDDVRSHTDKEMTDSVTANLQQLHAGLAAKGALIGVSGTDNVFAGNYNDLCAQVLPDAAKTGAVRE